MDTPESRAPGLRSAQPLGAHPRGGRPESRPRSPAAGRRATALQLSQSSSWSAAEAADRCAGAATLATWAARADVSLCAGRTGPLQRTLTQQLALRWSLCTHFQTQRRQPRARAMAS